MHPTQHPWIEKGYHTFAYEGPLGLKVERLAREIGKNKSSFYHHFADLEVFIQLLLKHHLEQAHIMAQKEAASTNQEELVTALVEHKIDLLFNRQLRVHRQNPDFEACFCQVTDLTVPAFMPIWSKILGLEGQTHLAGLVLQLSLENFYLQITDETLNPDWINQYIGQLKTLTQEFKKTGQYKPIDGTV